MAKFFKKYKQKNPFSSITLHLSPHPFQLVDVKNHVFIHFVPQDVGFFAENQPNVYT